MYAPKVAHTTQAYKNFLTAVKKKKLKSKVAKKKIQKGIIDRFEGDLAVIEFDDGMKYIHK